MANESIHGIPAKRLIYDVKAQQFILARKKVPNKKLFFPSMPGEWLLKAANLPGKALAVACVIQLEAAFKKRSTLDDDTFREMERHYSVLGPLRRLFSHILHMKVVSLPVGQDSCNRYLSSVFSTMTGRTMPSPARHIWGQPAWIRGLIRPPPGYVLILLDWKGQEYAILAGRSGDQRMIDDYCFRRPVYSLCDRCGACPSGGHKGHSQEIA
jgi:hypothetical protein